MTNGAKSCFNCGQTTNMTLYDFAICSNCESELKLLTDTTIKKHKTRNPSFAKEAQFKLAYLEKEYAGKKIKLLHILERLKDL